jgi:hypothetical protein
MSFTHLEFPIGGDEKESQCLVNRETVEVALEQLEVGIMG